MSKEVASDADQESSLLSLQNEVRASLSQCTPSPPVRPRLACCLCTPLPSMQHRHRTVPSTLAQKTEFAFQFSLVLWVCHRPCWYAYELLASGFGCNTKQNWAVIGHDPGM